MSGPVDVLVVMDENIRRAEEAGNIERSDRLQAARAAVAKLIDKAARHIHAVDHPVNDGDDAARQERTLRALNAALTNVGPQS